MVWVVVINTVFYAFGGGEGRGICNSAQFPCGVPTMYAKSWFFFFQAEDGIRDYKVTGVQTCALPIFDEHVGHLSGRDQCLRSAIHRAAVAHVHLGELRDRAVLRLEGTGERHQPRAAPDRKSVV